MDFSSSTTPFFSGHWFCSWVISSLLLAGMLHDNVHAFTLTTLSQPIGAGSSVWFTHSLIPKPYRSLIPFLFPSRKESPWLDMRGDKHKQFALKALSPAYTPKNENQRRYVDALQNKTISMVVNLGPAGTGKTLFACHAAIQELRRGTIQRIIITRPVVSVDEEIGFLPGNIAMKMDPWTRPIFDIFLECYSQTEIDSMVRAGVIEISPLAFMRGRTFKKAFILADEMQNSSPNQMFMLLTRIGTGSKMVITGDIHQSDRGSQNGLADLVNRIRKETTTLEGMAFIEMQGEDVERSPMVKQLLRLYNTTSTTARVAVSRRVDPALAVNVTGLPRTELPLPTSPFVVVHANDTATVATVAAVAGVSASDASTDADSAMIPKKHVPTPFQQRASDFLSFSESKWEGW